MAISNCAASRQGVAWCRVAVAVGGAARGDSVRIAEIYRFCGIPRGASLQDTKKED